MQFNLATVSLLIGIVSAGVLPREKAAPDAAALITHFFACVDSDFKGTCNNFQISTGACLNFVAPYQDSISSIGPDKGTTCVLWQDFNCQGNSITFTYPGLTNLGAFNDIASSIKCTE
ncbi:hypothetical protein EV127DRAFT_476668 [Xylaria flabelliformis]|nr:hypothetical protein EV127DRAFT_476668 [Xylaria flabelliformis]